VPSASPFAVVQGEVPAQEQVMHFERLMFAVQGSQPCKADSAQNSAGSLEKQKLQVA
jgi:hypothetical protein